MKKFLSVVVALAIIALAVPAFGLYDNNSENATATSNATGGNGGNGFGGTGGRSDSSSSSSAGNVSGLGNRAYSPEASATQGQMQGQGQGQIAAQGQGQLGIVSPSQSTSVGGDTTKNTAYVMTAPNTVAGKDQQASSIYSIFGGINVAQTAEYVVCREKMDVIENLKKGGYLSVEEAAAEMAATWKQFKDNTQEKRVLWIGPKTRGVHLGNLAGLLAMDSCNEINTDNWLGLKPIVDKAIVKKVK